MTALLLAALAGCAPTCEQSCKKLIDCALAESPRTALEECQEQCEAQQALYDSWTDDPEEKSDRLQEQRRCVKDATCEEIADGVCYDEALSSF
jgi:hypothetical protein